LWQNVGNTSDVLKKLIVEMYVGGMSQRDIEYGLESAVGQFLLSKSMVSDITESLAEEYEAFRTRDLSQEPIAYLFIDTVYEPLRRWGQKAGVLCVWAICEDGRKVLLSLSTANSESYESCLEVLRGLVVYLQLADNGAGPVRRYSHVVNKTVLLSPTGLTGPW
jgi:transposase-like protein